jgi:UDP-N-acetylmuramyl pentapeptide synthase
VTRFEKAAMLRDLPPHGIAVLNGDDPNVMWMRETTKARIVTFGLGETNDVRATDAVFEWPRGMTFRVHARGAVCVVRTRLLGRTSILPVLAAIAVALEEGFDLAPAIAPLEELQPTRERLQMITTPGGAVLLRDEYKSSLESIDAALDAFEQIPARRKIVVLGDVEQCPGRKRDTYRRLGDRIGRIAHQAIFLGSDCQGYVAAAVRAGMSRSATTKADDDLEKAFNALPADLAAGDVVLIKGRSSQRLARVSLFLLGRKVRCRIETCPLNTAAPCDRCQILERGWTADDHLALGH